MVKISGLVLDYYDDTDRALREKIPGADDIVKLGMDLSSDERELLPSDLFALTLWDGEHELRKFAMVDAANTQLSVQYFMQTGHKLPVDAQKLAAQNLITGCGWYGLEVPETLEKVALGVGGLISGALTLPGAVRESKANLNIVQGTGGTIMSPEQRRAVRASQVQRGMV